MAGNSSHTPCCEKCLDVSTTRSEELDHNTRPEEAIAEVESLYEIGVKVGFLKQNRDFAEFLRSMHRIYEKISRLNEEDNEGSASGSSSGGRDDLASNRRNMTWNAKPSRTCSQQDWIRCSLAGAS